MGTLRITTIRGDEKNLNKLSLIYLFYFRILSKMQVWKNAFIDVKIIADVFLFTFVHMQNFNTPFCSIKPVKCSKKITVLASTIANFRLLRSLLSFGNRKSHQELNPVKTLSDAKAVNCCVTNRVAFFILLQAKQYWLLTGKSSSATSLLQKKTVSRTLHRTWHTFFNLGRFH